MVDRKQQHFRKETNWILLAALVRSSDQYSAFHFDPLTVLSVRLCLPGRFSLKMLDQTSLLFSSCRGPLSLSPHPLLRSSLFTPEPSCLYDRAGSALLLSPACGCNYERTTHPQIQHHTSAHMRTVIHTQMWIHILLALCVLYFFNIPKVGPEKIRRRVQYLKVTSVRINH